MTSLHSVSQSTTKTLEEMRKAMPFCEHMRTMMSHRNGLIRNMTDTSLSMGDMQQYLMKTNFSTPQVLDQVTEWIDSSFERLSPYQPSHCVHIEGNIYEIPATRVSHYGTTNNNWLEKWKKQKHRDPYGETVIGGVRYYMDGCNRIDATMIASVRIGDHVMIRHQPFHQQDNPKVWQGVITNKIERDGSYIIEPVFPSAGTPLSYVAGLPVFTSCGYVGIRRRVVS